MDIHDITKHPFKIECPAELKDFPGEPFGDHWVFTFDNGYSVSCVENVIEPWERPQWEVAIIKPGETKAEVVGYMNDDDGDISDLVDRVAHLEKP